jgi:hypothetical protein
MIPPKSFVEYGNATISRPHLACHALRHATITMAAKYIHIQGRGKARHTQSISIKPA